MDGIKLSFDNEVFDYIVERAVEFKLGARGLRSICEIIMIDVMYELPPVENNELLITVDYAKSKLGHYNLAKLRAA